MRDRTSRERRFRSGGGRRWRLVTVVAVVLFAAGWAPGPAHAGATTTVEFTFDFSDQEAFAAEQGNSFQVVENSGTLQIENGQVVGGEAHVEIVQGEGGVSVRSTSDYVFRADGTIEHSSTRTIDPGDGSGVPEEIQHPVNDFEVDLAEGTGHVVASAAGDLIFFTFEPVEGIAPAEDEGSSSGSSAGSSAEEGDDGGGSPIVPILIGIVVLAGIVGIVVLVVRRRSGGPGAVVGGGPVSAGDGYASGGDPGGAHPEVPVAYATVPGQIAEQPAPCDWSLYLATGSGKAPAALRQAKGTECCKYVVTITTTGDHDARAVKGDQSEAGDGRLRLAGATSTVGQPGGLDVTATARTRSGPGDDPTLMQGLGDEGSQGGAGAGTGGTQQHPFEEEPDVAAHSDYGETTRIDIRHTGDCDHTPNYTWNGSATVVGRVDQECTNERTDPNCPVELGSVLHAAVKVSGDLSFGAALRPPGSPDDTEGDSEVVNPIHDHPGREQEHGEWRASASPAAKTVHRDDTLVAVSTDTTVDAGVIVPDRVKDATRRVTADVTAELAPRVSVDVAPDHTCAGACSDPCPHAKCGCACAFHLRIGGWGAIEVDGRTYPLKRSGGRLAPGATAHWST